MFAAELACCTNYDRASHKRIAALVLLILVVQKCNVSPFELRQLELDLDNGGSMDRMLLTASLIGFDFVGDRVESLPHQNFPNERFAYLDVIRASYTDVFIDLIKTVRPHGISSSSDLLGLVRDLITDNLVILP